MDEGEWFACTWCSSEREDCLRVRGELDLAATGLLHEAIEQRPEGNRELCVDLTDCIFIDSSGVAGLVFLYRAARREGRPMRLLLSRSSAWTQKICAMLPMVPVEWARNGSL